MKELFRRDPEIHKLIDEQKFDALKVTGQTLYDVIANEEPRAVIKKRLGLEPPRCKALRYPDIVDFILKAATQESKSAEPSLSR